ncbi:myoneurin-like isoform X2 [Prorops nasuta]|uniref:myoneurin-like isoform X2 n=1 Tax=Prorops nasuta TaxID=863751 RepID=UPI0034CFBE49
MSKIETNGIAMASPPAIHLGPIVTPGTNETFSIVIPLNAQMTTITNDKPDKSCKDCGKDNKQPQLQATQQPLLISSPDKTDKTKGCPYPTCTRYGRAFSRAHDLKRHIIRHEVRKEKLMEVGKQQMRAYTEYSENLANLAFLQRSQLNIKIDGVQRVQEAKNFDCQVCKKKYTNEISLKVHMASHDKLPDRNICGLCGANFNSLVEAQAHMKQHTMDILQASSVFEKANSSLEKESNKDDDFLLEEMLLLNKNPRYTGNKLRGKGDSDKIRCDYCSKTFKTKWTLSSHVAAHEGRFQFDCGQCGKRFVRKSHYEGHVRSHEAARPYVCEQCGKTFKELKHRREHAKRKHPANPSAIQTLLDSISPCASDEAAVDPIVLPTDFTS